MTLSLEFFIATRKTTAITAALVILNYRLYVYKHWTIYDFATSLLKDYGSDIRRGKTRIRHYYWVSKGVRYKRPYVIIAIAFYQGRAIGAMTIEGIYCNFYIKPEFRQKGAASQLWNRVSKEFDLSKKIMNTGSSRQAAALRTKLGIAGSFTELRKK